MSSNAAAVASPSSAGGLGNLNITDDMIDAVLGDFESVFTSNVDASIAAKLDKKSNNGSPLSRSPMVSSPSGSPAAKQQKLPRKTMWSKSDLGGTSAAAKVSPPASPLLRPPVTDQFVGSSNTLQQLGESAREETKLKKAAQTGDVASVKQLLAQGGINLNATRDGGSGKTPLFCACENGHAEVLKLLLKGKADPLRTDKNGKAPLDAAIKKGDAATTELIMAAACKAQAELQGAGNSNGNGNPVVEPDLYLAPAAALANGSSGAAAILEPDLYVEPNAALGRSSDGGSRNGGAGGGAAAVVPDLYEAPVPAPPERGPRSPLLRPPGTPLLSPMVHSPLVPPRNGATPSSPSLVGPPPPPRSPRLQQRAFPGGAGGPQSPVVPPRSPHGQRRPTALEAWRRNRDSNVTQFEFGPLPPTPPATVLRGSAQDDEEQGDGYCDLIGENGAILTPDATFEPGPLHREKDRAKQTSTTSKPPAYIPAPSFTSPIGEE